MQHSASLSAPKTPSAATQLTCKLIPSERAKLQVGRQPGWQPAAELVGAEQEVRQLAKPRPVLPVDRACNAITSGEMGGASWQSAPSKAGRALPAAAVACHQARKVGEMFGAYCKLATAPW